MINDIDGEIAAIVHPLRFEKADALTILVNLCEKGMMLTFHFSDEFHREPVFFGTKSDSVKCLSWLK